jgi:hypothetical protein
MPKVLAVDALLAPLVCSTEPLVELSFPGFRIVSIRVLIALALVFSPALELALADSPSSEGVDEEVHALIQELRELPRARELGCTPCAMGQGSPAEQARRYDIGDRLHALGSAAVPALARELESSLQGSDVDQKATVISILGDLGGERQSRDGSPHGKNDISAALPALILALDDPTVRGLAASTVGQIGPKAADAVPKFVTLLGDGDLGEQAAACNGLRGIDPLPALRQALSDPNPNKQQSARHAIATIEARCFGATEFPADSREQLASVSDQGIGSPCNAPPYWDTPAAYEAFARPLIGLSLSRPKFMLEQMCIFKRHPNLIRTTLHGWGLSEEDINTKSTVALVQQQIAGMVQSRPPLRPWQVPKGADSPADLFMCLQPNVSCQQIPETPSTPFHTLLECQALAALLGWPGAGVRYECRSKYVGPWELQGIAYRLDQASAVWVLIASGSGGSYYVDTSSITFHGDGRRAWFKLTFPHHSERWDDGIKYVAEESSMWEFRCANNEMRTPGADLFSFEDGSVRSGWTTFEWSPVQGEPGSPLDLAKQYLCNLARKQP